MGDFGLFRGRWESLYERSIVGTYVKRDMLQTLALVTDAFGTDHTHRSIH